MRIAWVSDFLTDGKRAELRIAFERLLPPGRSRRTAFLDAVSEALSEYHQLYVPAEGDATGRPAKMRRLAVACSSFADAVSALDDDSRDILEQTQWVLAGKNKRVPDFAMTAAVAEWARLTGAAAASLSKTKRTKGRSVGGAVAALVELLARAYSETFRERPSWSREGTFARVVALSLEAGGIDRAVDETKLKGIIGRLVKAGLITSVRPKPGPKTLN